MVGALFHIHADAEVMTARLRDRLVVDLGYSVDDFADNADGSTSYAPAQHVTFKTSDARLFRQGFRASCELIVATGGFRGYLEGEFLARDVTIETGRPFDARVALPWVASTSQRPDAGFRESEIHISIPIDGLDPALSEALRAMGFFVATMRKPAGTAEIYTIQGTRRAIGDTINDVQLYLQAAGGFASAKLKEEVVARYWLSHRDIELPPQIDLVQRRGLADVPRHLAMAA